LGHNQLVNAVPSEHPRQNPRIDRPRVDLHPLGVSALHEVGWWRNGKWLMAGETDRSSVEKFA